MDEILLLPKPRQVTFYENQIASASLAVAEIFNPEGPYYPGDEAYRVEVRSEGVRLIARHNTGLRWARATWNQLRKQNRIPELDIEDAPLFAHRGIMLDISRDRIPRMETLFELVDLLEQLKMNHLQLYVEHSLAYAGHEDVWRAASPITMEELSALNGYCRAHGVALTANQNCFGHFERWLRHPRYADLAERHTGIMANDSFYVPPNTLCPMDSRCLKLIEDLLAQQLPHCSGTYANIGCDEPWDLGRGRSREICAQRGKAAVFSEHVGHVVQLVKNLGKRAQFWCDPHPNEDDNLPVDLVALVWEYEANRPFASRVQSHVNAGREVWVAPGSSCWNSSTGRTWNRRGNLDNAANESAATGFLGTIWGDGGHRQPWPISQFAIGDMAMAAWSGANQYNSLANGLHIFGDQALGAWLEALGEADKEICRGERPDFNGHPPDGKTIHNSTALWVEMHAHLYEPAGKGDLAAWMEVRQRLQQLQQNMPEKLDQNLRQECALALELAFFAADRAVLRRSGPTIDERKALAVRMAEMIAKHRKQWLHRCRYGGLEDSTQHFLQLAKNW